MCLRVCVNGKVHICVLAIIVAKIEKALGRQEGHGTFIDYNFLMQTFCEG